jgi:hypothetical protein
MGNSADQSSDQVSVTTETASGRRTLRVVCVLVVTMGILGLLSAALFAIVPEALPFRANWDRLLVIAICLWGTVSALTTPRSLLRGTWQLDDEQITFDPLRGQPQSLPWQDVQSVQWGADRIRFRGVGAELTLDLRYETPDRKEVAKQFLRQRLGDIFDLSDRPLDRITLRGTCLVIGLAIAFTLLGLGAALLHDTLVTSNAELSLLALMYGVLPLFALAAYVGVRQYRRSWRIRKPAVLPD